MNPEKLFSSEFQRVRRPLRQPGGMTFFLHPVFIGSFMLAVLILTIGCDQGQTRIPVSALGYQAIVGTASGTTGTATGTGTSTSTGTTAVTPPATASSTASGSVRTYTITGVVSHATSREPLSGIIVKLLADSEKGPELGMTYTSGEGRYYFENQKKGMYFLRFYHPDITKFDPATSVVTILTDGTVSPQSTNVDLVPAPPVDQAFSIYGMILDGYSGEALDFVKCSMSETGKIMSDYLGNFFFDNLVPGTYRLVFSKPGYEEQAVNVKVRADGTTFPATLTYRLVQVTEGNKGSIIGRIVSEGTQAGIPGLVVRVYRMKLVTVGPPEIWNTVAPAVKSTLTTTNSAGTVKYDEDGTFRLTHLEPTTDSQKYAIYVGDQGSEILLRPLSYSISSDTQVVYYNEDVANNPSRYFSLHFVDVSANTSTYITNYERP